MTALDQPSSSETFLQRRLREKAEREAADRSHAFPEPAIARAPVSTESRRGRAWVTRKLEQQCADLAARTEGDRNHTLNAAAYSLGRLVPKWLDHDEVGRALYDAARACGLEHTESIATIRSGLAGGMQDPRDPPVDPDDPSGGLASLVDGPVETRLARAVGFDDSDDLDDDAIAVLNHERRVHAELVVLRARHDAKQLHTAEIAARTFRVPAFTHTLTDELAIPDEPVRYAVEDLLPAGGNALLAAQYKSGKTTLVMNLLRAYADDEPFLGRFRVTPGTGRIAFFNYELSDTLCRRWLRDMGINNTDRVSVLNLRGYRLPLTAASVEDWIVGWLREHDITFWIADPFARAATGTDENSNTEVGVWLDTFDVIKDRAGVSEAVLPTHTGRTEHEAGQERARGATRLDDWADVRWLMTKDDEDRRYFRATGRDVELAEEMLTYDAGTRALQYGGGDRKWVKNRALAQSVLDFINANPGVGVKAIQAGVVGNKVQIDAMRQDLIRRHRVRVDSGERGMQMHYANEETA